MKVVLVAGNFKRPLVGGVDVYADRLGQALLRLGHEVVIIAVDSTGPPDERCPVLSHEQEFGLEIDRIRFAFNSRPKKTFDMLYDPQVGAAILAVLERTKPDLVIIMNFYTITYAAVEAAKQLGLPVFHIATDFLPVCRKATLIQGDGRSCESGESPTACAACFMAGSRRGRTAVRLLDSLSEPTLRTYAARRYSLPHPLSLFNPYWEQIRITEERLKLHARLRPQIDRIFAPTRYTHDMFVRGGFDRKQMLFRPFGVEPANALSNVQHSPSAQIRFLFIGRLQPYKGTHVLLRAFNELAEPRGATLTLYGAIAAGYEAYFQELQSMIDANDRVQFLGQIDADNLAAAFAEADYFVLPSTWHENSPLILLDALQARTPVIASRIGGVTDMLEAGQNGYLFEPGNWLELREILQAAIDEPEKVETLRMGIELDSIDDYAADLVKVAEAVLADIRD